MKSYLEYFVPKYKDPSSPLPSLVERNGIYYMVTDNNPMGTVVGEVPLSGTDPVGEFYVMGEVAGPLLKWFGKGLKWTGNLAWKGASKVAPKATGAVETAINAAGEYVGNALNKAKSKVGFLKRTSSGKIEEEPFTYTANRFKYTSKHDPVSAFTETSPEVSDLLVQEQKDKLIKYFNSEEYWTRLKKAGFSDKAAKERIVALTSNPERFVIKQGVTPNGASAVTEITPFNLSGEQSIIVDLSKIKSKQDLDAVLFEELSHAGELNGQTWDRTVDLINQYYGSVEKFKAARPDLYNKITEGVSKELNFRLHNNVAVPFNESLGLTSNLKGTMEKFYQDLSPEERVRFDEIWDKLSASQKQQKAALIAEYYMLPEEKRARALSAVIEAIDKHGYYPGASRISQLRNPLSTEFQSVYKNSGNYLDNFISFGAPITIGGTVYGTYSR